MSDRFGRLYSFPSSIAKTHRQNGRVSWGCEYDIPDLEAFSRIVSFVYGDSRRWEKIWEQRRLQKFNALRSLHYLAKIAVKNHGYAVSSPFAQNPGRYTVEEVLKNTLVKIAIKGSRLEPVTRLPTASYV